MKKNYFSKKLQKEVELEVYQENGIDLITHFSLENLVGKLNLEGIHLTVNLPAPTVVTTGDKPYILYTGYVSDGEWTVPCNGGALYNSLNNEVSQKYPGEMAFKRAYDRGVLTWLCFDEKLYSKEEIDCIYAEDGVSSNSASEQAAPPASSTSEDVEMTFSLEDDTVATPPVTEKTSEDPGDIKIDVLLYKNNPSSIRDIYNNPDTKKGKDWLNMAINKHWLSPDVEKAVLSFLESVA